MKQSEAGRRNARGSERCHLLHGPRPGAHASNNPGYNKHGSLQRLSIAVWTFTGLVPASAARCRARRHKMAAATSPIGPRRQWEEPALLTRYCIYMDRFIDCFLSSEEHGLIDLRRHHNSDVYTNFNESRFMSRCTLRDLSAHLSIDGETRRTTPVSESFITLKL